MESMTERGTVEGWYVELNGKRERCISCKALTYGRNEYGQPQDFTCYFEAIKE